MQSNIAILEFYSTCQAPSAREELRMKLGMGEEEFNYYEQFKNGTSDFWLVIT